MINLTELTSFPTRPEFEVPRDHVVAQISVDFDTNCQKQIVIGKPLTGKTNLLAQFACHFSDRCISYFVTSDPWTHRQHNFLLALCNQLTELLQEPPPPTTINLDGLKSHFSVLLSKLNMKARQEKVKYFFAIDGLEHGLNGIEGERIVDVLPQTYPIGPFLLLSCRQSEINKLPKHINADKSIQPLPFSQSETISLLKSAGFLNEEIKEIHRWHEGHPGSLKAVYEAKKSNPNFSLELALQTYDRVIEQQIQFFISAKGTDTAQKAMNYLAVCPTGLPSTILSGLLRTNKRELEQALESIGSSIYEIRGDKIEFCNEKTRNLYASQMGIPRGELLDDLLDFIKKEHPTEEFLLTSLYLERKDYQGLQDQLGASSVLATVQNPLYGASSVLQRLRAASEMASEQEESEELFRWNLGMSAIKSYIDNSVNDDEIKALIAIGESKEALRQVYLLSDETSRIRFLAQVYSAMKSNGERVSIEAKSELKAFVTNLRVNDLDENLVQELAIDIFPILPDVSISLLENVRLHRTENRVVDLFAVAISERFSTSNTNSNRSLSDKNDYNFQNEHSVHCFRNNLNNRIF